MKLFLPDNIFSKVAAAFLPKNIELVYRPSSLVAKELETTTYGIALMPSLDLIQHQTFFVSGKAGISFDGLLSNTFFYFVEGEKRFEKIFLRGDVSMNEILLAKILFEERYSSNIDLILDTSPAREKDKDYLVSGYENFENDLFNKGISFADEIAETLDLPYVNYVFASQDKEALSQFEKIITPNDEDNDGKIEAVINSLLLSDESKLFIKENLSTVYFDLTPNEQDALNELIKLVYYHGIVDDMFDVKYI